MKQSYLLLCLNIWLVAPVLGQSAFEGKLEYVLTYEASPQKASQINMLPKEISLQIKGEKYRFDQPVIGGALQSFIVDNISGHATLLMNIMGQAFQIPMKKSQLEQLQPVEEFALQATTNTAEVLGYKCSHSSYSIEGETYDVYYTPEIHAPNTIPQLKALNGMPLRFTVIKDGMKVHYECKAVTCGEVLDSVFEVANQVKILPFDSFAKAFAEQK